MILLLERPYLVKDVEGLRSLSLQMGPEEEEEEVRVGGGGGAGGRPHPHGLDPTDPLPGP